MRHPFDVAWSPEASSSTPAFCSSSWYFAISPRIFSCGITPASESFVAFTTIMNRMVLSPLRAQSLLLLLELRFERGTEIFDLEHLANLHFTLLERSPLQPFDGLVQHHESHRRLLLVLGSTYTTSEGRRDRRGGSSSPDPLSHRERGNVMSPPSPERRGGKGVRTDEREGHV